MRKILIILRWEISKLFGNWKKTVTVFLLPSVLMMLALNLFPAIMNYMTTGSFSQRPILAINAPDSFKDFSEEKARDIPFAFEFSERELPGQSVIREIVKRGQLILIFKDNFDTDIENYYQRLVAEEDDVSSDAGIEVMFDANNMSSVTKADNLYKYVFKLYKAYLLEELGGEYKKIGMDRFLTDDFNPVTFVTRNRANANDAAMRLIPGVMGILLYYCVYSLSCDMFAAERDRGFFRKLLMTPVSGRSIFAGKALAITVISSASAYLTFVLLFFASWLNRSNDAMSLLPFGMILGFEELIAFAVCIPPMVIAMTGMCIAIIFSLEKLPDILMNLQLPLIFFLIMFFIQLLRFEKPFSIEFILPVYGGICSITDVMGASPRWSLIIPAAIINLLTGILLIYKAGRKQEE